MAKKAEREEGKAKKEGNASHKARKGERDSSHKARKPAKEEEKKAGKEEKNVKGREKERGREEKKKKKEKPKRGKVSGKEKFVELKPEEIVEAIVHLANEGHSQSEIGMILRDQYGIPKVAKAAGKKIGAIMQQQNLMQQIPEDLMNLIRKSVALREHIARNKKDRSAKHGLMLTVSKIRALERYYKKKGRLPMQWRYSPETAALLAK